jgi:hypothetical protein
MGAGRIVYQELTRITKEIQDGVFFNNPEILHAINNCKVMNSDLHIYGLLSDGGVHSHTDHLYAILEMCKKNGLDRVYVDCFLDGRDTPPQSGIDFIAKLEVRPVDGLRVVGSGYLGKGCAVNDNVVRWNPTISKGDNYTRNRYSAGVEYKTKSYSPGKYKEARPASVRAEWLGGKDGDVTSRCGYLTVCVPVVKALDVVASGETFDRNTKVDGWDQTNLTAGVQYWFYKKCRLQLQYTRCLCGEQIAPEDYNWVQAQVQFAF